MPAPLRWRWRDWPWALKLGVVLVLLAILPLGVLTLASEMAARADSVAESRERNLLRARNTAALLDRFLADVEADVTVLALAPSTVAVLADPADAGRRGELATVLSAIRSTKRIDVLYVMDRGGAIVSATDPALAGRSRLTAPFFLSAMAGQTRAHELAWSPDDGGIFINVSVPVRDGDRVIGVAVARIAPAELDRLIEGDTSFGGLGEFGLLWNERGLVMSAPARPDLRYRPLAPIVAYTRERLAAEQRFGAETAGLLGRPIADAALLEHSRWQLYDDATDPHVSTDLGAGAVELTSVPLTENRWTYAIAVPQARLLAAVHAQSRRNLQMALATALVAVLLSAAAARWVARPLRKVGDAARALAAGDMTRRAGLGRRDEIGRVGAAFDAMADALAAKEQELRRHAGLLEARVAERTAALEFLARAGTTLALSFDYGNAPEALARLSIPVLGELCSVDLLQNGRLRCAAVAATSAAHEARVRTHRERHPVDADGDHPLAAALRGGPTLAGGTAAAVFAAGDGDDADAGRLDDLRLHSAMMAPLVARGQRLGVMTFARTADGRPYTPEELKVAGELAHRAAIAIDNGRLYRELRESNRLKDEFLSVVSHELRTPLNAVLGWLHVLRRGRLEPEQQDRALEAIERNARTQARLVDDLLDTSRVVSGKLHLDVDPVDIEALVAGAAESFAPQARARDVALDVEVAAPLPPVRADEARLQQALGNLLANALKFTPAGGRVLISAAPAGPSVEVRVADTGIGIAPDFLPFVFDRFRQADSTTTRVHGGLGLGLAITRHLIELHGGTIRAESAGERCGATFVVTLPIARADDEPAAAARAAARDLRGMYVLVVDDDGDAREMTRAMLGAAGARVDVARSAREARDLLAVTRPDVVVADIGMPDEDGYALLRALRAEERGDGRAPLPAIALTAYARDEDRAHALDAGFDRHLAKPVDGDALLAAVRELGRVTDASPPS